MEVSSRLTVIVTTSPVRSNPSTDLIQEVFESFHYVPGLDKCSKIIVFDGYEIHTTKSEKRGRISASMVGNYKEYIRAVQQLVDHHPMFANTRCKVLDERLGFGHAVRVALSEVTTNYAMVLQHDFAFCKTIELSRLVEVMETHPVVNYIGMLSASTIGYAETRSHGPQQHLPLEVEYFNGEPFVKLMFWYDKAHLARVDYYRNAIFGRHCCVRKGDFIEDRFGHWELKKIYIEGLSAHARFGTYLWYPDNGTERCIQHLQGRRFQLEQVKNALYPERVLQRHAWNASMLEREERQARRQEGL